MSVLLLWQSERETEKAWSSRDSHNTCCNINKQRDFLLLHVIMSISDDSFRDYKRNATTNVTDSFPRQRVQVI